MKIAIIKTNNTVMQQLLKIDSELQECFDEVYLHNNLKISKDLCKAQLEALDVLTAAFNLVNMLNIPGDVIKKHEEKMISYSQDPKRMYEIIKWVNLEEEK